MSIDDLSPQNEQKIIGDDGQYAADVVQENGIKKLVVKSSTAPTPIGNLFFDFALNGSSFDLNVDGSVTPVVFQVDAGVTYDQLVFSLVFEAFDDGIKMDTFLGQNVELTNGILIEIKAEDNIFQFKPIRNTQEFDSLFSFGAGRSWQTVFASGTDSLVARFGTSVPFTMKPQGTYGTDDYIKVTIQDNLSNITRLRFLAVGQVDV